jgi:hypothetical protein
MKGYARSYEKWNMIAVGYNNVSLIKKIILKKKINRFLNINKKYFFVTSFSISPKTNSCTFILA